MIYSSQPRIFGPGDQQFLKNGLLPAGDGFSASIHGLANLSLKDIFTLFFFKHK